MKTLLSFPGLAQFLSEIRFFSFHPDWKSEEGGGAVRGVAYRPSIPWLSQRHPHRSHLRVEFLPSGVY